MNNLSPILVSVYNRFTHLKKSIKALQSNPLASKSILYIVSDAARDKKDIDIVNTIRSYCKDITGFLEVKCIFRKENLGSFKSCTLAMNEVIENHGKLIFMEDDTLVSEDFLTYMNNGLDTYKNEKRIFSISGYNIPSTVPKSYKHDVYLWSRYNSWGMATWLDRWKSIDWDLEGYNAFITNKQQVRDFNKIAFSTLPTLKADRANKTIAGDVRISLNMFLKNTYTIYPVRSKVKNIGFDGTGEHCGVDANLNKQMTNVEDVTFPSELKPSRAIYRWRAWYHLNIKGHIIKPIVLKAFPFLRKNYE